MGVQAFLARHLRSRTKKNKVCGLITAARDASALLDGAMAKPFRTHVGSYEMGSVGASAG